MADAVALLKRAASEADTLAPAIARLARAYLARLSEEYPAYAPEREGGPPPRRASGRAELGYEHRSGERLPGFIANRDWIDGAAVPDYDGATVRGSGDLSLSPRLTATVSVARQRGEWELAEAYAVGSWRTLGVWVGRRPLEYRQAAGGAVVVNSAVALDGGGFFLGRPLLLPGVLRRLGRFHFETSLSRMDSVGAIQSPWFWTARGSLAPHERLTFGVTRAAVFGGEGVAPVTLGRVLKVLVGAHALEWSWGENFENQVISLDAKYRLPVVPFPLVAYLEWGAEDSAGAWRDVPGFVLGGEVPSIPAYPGIALGVEYASFARSCCGNPPWYRHHTFSEGWASAGRLLGHPLGGHGSEYLMYARGAMLDARLRTELTMYSRQRDVQNVFAPGWQGRSRGGAVRAAFRAGPSLDVELDVEVESSEGNWQRSLGAAVVRWHF